LTRSVITQDISTATSVFRQLCPIAFQSLPTAVPPLPLRAIDDRLDMPGNQVCDLIMFITQNGMKLPLGRRRKEFAALSDNEVMMIEAVVADGYTATVLPLI
jgi:hypothetical protein